jgi:hypothetical protein
MRRPHLSDVKGGLDAPSSRPGNTRKRGITTNSRWPCVRWPKQILETWDERRTVSPKHSEMAMRWMKLGWGSRP